MSNLIKLKQISGGTTLKNTVDTHETEITALQGLVGETSVESQIQTKVDAARTEVYQITSDKTTLVEIIADADEATTEALAGVKSGDVLIVTTTAGVKSAYHYDGEWIACDGKVDASSVILSKDIKLAGSYTQVGNIKKEGTTGDLSAKGKSVEALLTEILSKREQPAITANPSVSALTFSQGKAYEVGTSVTPSYSATFDDGSYTYADNTGVSVSSWSVTQSDNNTNHDVSATSDKASGSFASFIVADNTSYTIKATANHTAGNVAKDNLGDDSDPVVQIAEGSVSKTSGATTGYRSYFYGVLNNTDDLTSEIIRGLTNSNGAYSAAKTLTVKVNGSTSAKRIIVAIPSKSLTSTRTGVKKVMKTDGLATEITGSYTKLDTTVSVADARGTVDGVDTNTVEYTIWVYQPASIDPAEVHEISLA